MSRNMGKYWYKSAYHRNVVDMHISDCDKSFMTKFDSANYVKLLKLSRTDSAVIYTHSHVGLTYFPTVYGEMHSNLNGRDIFSELVDNCHRENIAVVAYFSLVFDDWAYANNPDWRMKTLSGEYWSEHSRYGVCCPNSEDYKEYIRNIVTELCTNYRFEGIRFDMTFWPGVCYCENCRDKFRAETGLELPEVINWQDPHWVKLQRSRERWLCEFAKNATDTVRAVNPDISVEHQSSTFPASYTFGVSADLMKQCDFMQGDFYGGYIQGSTACKMFYNLSPNLPFGFETSVHESLYDHTTLKKENMLFAKSCMAIANGGAFVFIDAVDPVGTLNEYVYETMGRVFDKTAPFEKYLNGNLIQDVAVYLSTESKGCPDDNGRRADAATGKTSSHLDAMFNSARALIKNHVLFGVITRANLDRLSEFKVIVLPDVYMMSKEEAEAFRRYVQQGGKLYVSNNTSMIDTDGNLQSNFMLSDVLGVDYEGQTEDKLTYITPKEETCLFPEYITAEYPLFIDGSQTLIKAHTGTKVLATLTKPYYVPHLLRPYASIHSNPPGINTDKPSITENTFGKGKVIYCTAILENNTISDVLFANLIKRLLGESAHISGSAPRQVEITAFECDDSIRLCLLSFQEEMPNLPIPSFNLHIRTGNRPVKRVLRLPAQEEVKFSVKDGIVRFDTEVFDTFTMYGIYFD